MIQDFVGDWDGTFLAREPLRRRSDPSVTYMVRLGRALNHRLAPDPAPNIHSPTHAHSCANACFARQTVNNVFVDATTSEPARAFTTATAVGAGMSLCGGGPVSRLRASRHRPKHVSCFACKHHVVWCRCVVCSFPMTRFNVQSPSIGPKPSYECLIPTPHLPNISANEIAISASEARFVLRC